MTDGTWLQNISQLGVTPKLVVEKICRAVGMVYEPTHTRRMAKAKGDEIRQIAAANADAFDIQARASMRIETEQLRHQQNLEAITLKALPHLTDQAKPAEVDDDWLVSFFELSRNASKEELRALWSRILAGEFNSPSLFSKRTLRLVAEFDQRDAQLFTTLCRFSVNPERMPLIYEPNAPMYKDAGLTYAALVHLQNIGLIRFSDITSFLSQGLPGQVQVTYFNTRFFLTLPGDPAKADHIFAIDSVMLSQAGAELAKICEPTAVPGFTDYLEQRWKRANIACNAQLIIQQ